MTNNPHSVTHTRNLIDRWEFVRFILSGVLATVANLSTVWICLTFFPFEFALVCGIGAGFASSFLLMKFYTFRARRWDRASGEVVRFLIVYSVGVALYYGVAYFLGEYILPSILPIRAAQMCGAAIGAGTMTFSSYAGHRFFTYRKTQG